MSLLRSPNEGRGGSQPDLSKCSDDDYANAKPQKNIRKRKVPMPEFDMKQEFESFRNEMKSFLSSFAEIQKEGTYKLQRDMTEIKEQLYTIKVSMDVVIEDQHKMKVELEQLKTLCNTNEHSIKKLQTDVNMSKTSRSSSSQAQAASFTYEEVLSECQERTQRQKNIIILGIPEPSTQDKNERFEYDRNEVLKVINNIYKNCPDPIKIFRIGKNTPGRNRLIKVCLESEQEALKLLRNRGNLQNNIKIYSDQTPNQQNHLKLLREELTQRLQSGEANLAIKYIRGTPKIILAQESKN